MHYTTTDFPFLPEAPPISFPKSFPPFPYKNQALVLLELFRSAMRFLALLLSLAVLGIPAAVHGVLVQPEQIAKTVFLNDTSFGESADDSLGSPCVPVAYNSSLSKCRIDCADGDTMLHKDFRSFQKVWMFNNTEMFSADDKTFIDSNRSLEWATLNLSNILYLHSDSKSWVLMIQEPTNAAFVPLISHISPLCATVPCWLYLIRCLLMRWTSPLLVRLFSPKELILLFQKLLHPRLGMLS